MTFQQINKLEYRPSLAGMIMTIYLDAAVAVSAQNIVSAKEKYLLFANIKMGNESGVKQRERGEKKVIWIKNVFEKRDCFSFSSE